MTPPSGIGIVEAHQLIIAQPAPVLLPDTCALLDVVRAPIRNSSYLIPQAEQFAALAAMSPKRLHVVISRTVTLEWNAHLAETVAEVETALQAMRVNLRAIREACTAVQLALPAELPADLENLPARLQERATSLYDSALVLGEDPECLSRAFARQGLPRRPARQGKGMNDCMILEHALCLCSQLRAEGFSPACVFGSSNTTDYCTGRALHPELAPEFTAVGLQFAPDLRTARHRLGL
jgi:hypothetical protein